MYGADARPLPGGRLLPLLPTLAGVRIGDDVALGASVSQESRSLRGRRPKCIEMLLSFLLGEVGICCQLGGRCDAQVS